MSTCPRLKTRLAVELVGSSHHRSESHRHRWLRVISHAPAWKMRRECPNVLSKSSATIHSMERAPPATAAHHHPRASTRRLPALIEASSPHASRTLVIGKLI